MQLRSHAHARQARQGHAAGPFHAYLRQVHHERALLQLHALLADQPREDAVCNANHGLGRGHPRAQVGEVGNDGHLLDVACLPCGAATYV